MDKMTNEVKRKYWMEIVRECNESGQTKQQWIKEHNICMPSFYQWQRTFRMETANQLLVSPTTQEVAPTQFVEVKSNQSSPVRSKSVIARNGELSVEIPDGISDELLIKIIRVLKNA